MATIYEGMLGTLNKSIFRDQAKYTESISFNSIDMSGITKPVTEDRTFWRYTDNLAKHAGIGGAAGATTTASIQAYDNYSTGRDLNSNLGIAALRGAGAGVLVGGVVNTLPKRIMNSYAKAGLTAPPEQVNELTKIALGEAQPLYAKYKEPANEFINIPLRNWKSAWNPVNYNKKVVEDFRRTANKYSNNSDLSIDAEAKKEISEAYNRIANTDEFKISKAWAIRNGKNMMAADEKNMTKQFAKSQAATQQMMLHGMFNSTYKHVFKPTGDIIRKATGQSPDVKWSSFKATDWTSLGVNGFGLYEGYNALNNVSQGDYGAAAGNALTFGLVKFKYGQLVGGIDTMKYLKSKGYSYKDSARITGSMMMGTYVGGAGHMMKGVGDSIKRVLPGNGTKVPNANPLEQVAKMTNTLGD